MAVSDGSERVAPSVPGPLELEPRLAKLEAELQRVRFAIVAVSIFAVAALAWSMIRPAQLDRNPTFDTVNARQFVVKQGEETLAKFGTYEKPPGAVLLLGQDDRKLPGVALHSRGELVVRGRDSRRTRLLGTSFFMSHGEPGRVGLGFELGNAESSSWWFAPRGGHASFDQEPPGPLHSDSLVR